MADPVKGAGGPAEERLFVLSSPDELARAAAGRLWGIVRERAAVLGRGVAAIPKIHVALSGGETPRRFLELLASEPYRGRFPWDEVHFYQVDERWVPPDHPLSNRRMLEETLLCRGLVPEGHFHPVDTTRPDAREGARTYEEALRRAFSGPSGGFPRFDVVLLGLGADGHTASLFPGSPALREETAWVSAVDGGDPPVPRVTLTVPVLNAAANVVFIVSGKEKAEALRLVLSGRAEGNQAPAALVSPKRGKVTFLADGPAASRVAAARPEGKR